MPALYHLIFTGWMLFLTPNQQLQSTEEILVCAQFLQIITSHLLTYSLT